MLSARRAFLKKSAGVAGLLAFSGFSRSTLRAVGAVAAEKHFEITDIKRTTVKLEFRPTPRRNMDREIPHWRYSEICDVTLKCGVTGTGETLLFYTWGATPDEAIPRVIGRSAIDVMWDDTLGAGLQMALFDAVGRAAEVPVHSLLGKRSTTQRLCRGGTSTRRPLTWFPNAKKRCGWVTCPTRPKAVRGLMCFIRSTKPAKSCRLSSRSTWTSTILCELRNRAFRFWNGWASIRRSISYEGPIPQEDVDGNRKITNSTHVKVAIHYGTPDPETCAQTRCCDGFVAGGGATKLMRTGRFCEETRFPLWLQLVGSGLTAAHSLHFGGVLKQAIWPAVNCHQLYETDMLVEPILLKNGHAVVPDRPGLGYEINRDTVAKLKIDKPAERPEPERLIETTWADGKRMYTANNGKVNFMLSAANADRYPYFAPGADTRLVPDDGTPRWRELYDRARKEGPIEG
jgi:L-alanine-DL-glutamate epimerase-like enolase superfamily enzyme